MFKFKKYNSRIIKRKFILKNNYLYLYIPIKQRYNDCLPL